MDAEHQQALADLQQEFQQANNGQQQRQLDATQVNDQGGVFGYNNNNPLPVEQVAFRTLLVGLGLNIDTANELFRQGVDSISKIKDWDTDRCKSVVMMISKSKSPECINPNQVFLGAYFQDNILLVAKWAKFQDLIGKPQTAIQFNQNPHTAEQTCGHLVFYKQISKSKATDDITLPP